MLAISHAIFHPQSRHFSFSVTPFFILINAIFHPHKRHFSSSVTPFLVACYLTLHPTLSVRPSVRLSVRPSIHLSIHLSVRVTGLVHPQSRYFSSSIKSSLSPFTFLFSHRKSCHLSSSVTPFFILSHVILLTLYSPHFSSKVRPNA